LLPTIQKLMAAGFVSQRDLANELNRRRIATMVTRLLQRLDRLDRISRSQRGS
jgi:predicted transcriptional regulator